MTEEIRIPRTLNAAVGALNGIESLLTARNWERAAIVWAFTYEGKPGPRTEIGKEVDRSTITDFAGLGIKGLASKPSVIAYRSAWKQAMEEVGAKDVRPGQMVELPDLPFPPVVSENDPRYQAITDRDAIRAQAEADGTGPAKALDIAKNKPAMEAAIVASPAVAAAAERALARRPITEKEAEVTLERVARAHPDVVERRGVGIREDRNRLAFERVRQEQVVEGEPMTGALDLLSQRDIGAEGIIQVNRLRTHYRLLGLLREEATSEDQELVLESLISLQAFAEHVLDIWRRPNGDLDAEFRHLREEMGDGQTEP